MNKSRAILITGLAAAVLIIGFSSHVIATTVTAQPIGATVVAPIVVTPVGAGLNFGSVGNSTAGTVTVVLDPVANSASSADGADVLSGTGAAAAQFNLSAGVASASYTVDFTSNIFPINLAVGVDVMTLTWAGNNGTTLSAGAFGAGPITDTMFVGGTLRLLTGPTQGVHAGAYDMDVVYN